MCYHASVPTKKELDVLFEYAVRTDVWNTFYHHISGFSYAALPVLSTEEPTALQAFNWGLIPAWSKDREHANEMRSYTLNAKSETIFEKPSFRTCIQKKRCLIFVDGFFEWREINKKKYPYFIRLKNQEAFAIGGIYDTWADKTSGELFNTCSMITTEANPLMAKIHNAKLRMPLIFTKENMFNWLQNDLDKEKITSLMQPLDENLMQAHTISKLITSRKENSNVEKVKDFFEYEETK